MQEGERMYNLCQDIFPVYRSITGDGVRRTYAIISDYIVGGGGKGLIVSEIKSGTKVFDWEVPEEWNIKDAFIELENGERILEFSKNNLYVVGYSEPVDKWISLKDLRQYIYTQPNQPNAIPYVTSYYNRRFGFCMSQVEKDKLQEGKYHIVIESEFSQGSLSYAELVIPGESEEEILFSTYSCHPSMANDNCSGMVLSAEIARYVGQTERRYTYRFLYLPETIGTITYLSQDNHLSHLKSHVKAGFTLSCVGDNGNYSIIHSKEGCQFSDRVLMNALHNVRDREIKEYTYLDRGSDERQYNSPRVGLSVVGFCRSKYWDFPEYHTSLDDMGFVSVEGFQGSFDVFRDVIDAIEYNKIFRTRIICEPQLGKRGLYPDISQKGNARKHSVAALTNFIAYADGKTDLIGISEAIKVPIKEMIPIVETLLDEKIIEEV